MLARLLPWIRRTRCSQLIQFMELGSRTNTKVNLLYLGNSKTYYDQNKNVTLPLSQTLCYSISISIDLNNKSIITLGAQEYSDLSAILRRPLNFSVTANTDSLFVARKSFVQLLLNCTIRFSVIVSYIWRMCWRYKLFQKNKIQFVESWCM